MFGSTKLFAHLGSIVEAVFTISGVVNNIVAENGTDFYVAENGTDFYIQG